MAALLVVFFPVLLLFFLLFMEKVEAPLRRSNDDVEEFLESARQDEVDTLISGGLRKAMDRWRKRRRLSRLLPVRNGRRQPKVDAAEDPAPDRRDAEVRDP